MRQASPRAISPLRTMFMTIGTVVSTPGIPDGAESKSWSFSAAVWGAWSVPIMSGAPERRRARSASLVAASLIGGFTLYSAPGCLSTSNVAWWRVLSTENPADLARSIPWGVVMWHMLTALPLNLEARRVIALISADAGRFLRWSLQQRSSPLSMRESSSAWTLMRRPVASASVTAGTSSASSLSSMLPVVDPMNSLKPTTRGASMRALIPGVTAANSP